MTKIGKTPLESQSIEQASPYAPLSVDKKEIRLLHLCPTVRIDDSVEGVLSLASLDDKGMCSYETISYLWGDPTSRDLMVLDGCGMRAPSAAIEALRRMRHTDQQRTLWIDSICINQNDLKERGQQVSIMSRIYRQGHHNLIYLGPGNVKLYQAIRDMNAIHDELLEDTSGMKEVSGTFFDDEQPLGRQKFSTSAMRCIADFTHVMEFFALSWFSRVWTFQEGALSLHSTCCVGSAEIPLLIVARVAVWISQKGIYVPTLLQNSAGIRTARDLFRFIDATHGCFNRTSGSFPAPSWLLNTSKALNCSDDRDRVFGMLGLIHWDGQQPLLLPDYHKSTRDVLRDATRFALLDANDVSNIWKHISHQSQQSLEGEKGPSWVPDWSHPWSLQDDPTELTNFIFRANNLMVYHSKDVATETYADADVFEQMGFTLDDIGKEVGSVLTTPMVQDTEATITWLEKSIALLQQTASDTSVASVLIAGTNIDRKPATDSDLAELRHCQNWLQDDLAEPTMPGLAAGRFYRALGRACMDRRPFRTASGYIGMGPKIMQEGDVAVVFYACRTPYVLRPHMDGFYRVVGDCYVYGVMDGEAMRENERSGWVKDQVFRLI